MSRSAFQSSQALQARLGRPESAARRDGADRLVVPNANAVKQRENCIKVVMGSTLFTSRPCENAGLYRTYASAPIFVSALDHHHPVRLHCYCSP